MICLVLLFLSGLTSVGQMLLMSKLMKAYPAAEKVNEVMVPFLSLLSPHLESSIKQHFHRLTEVIFVLIREYMKCISATFYKDN